MKQLAIPRVVVAGTHSGVGKTTVVTGLLAALRRRGLTAQPYKVGPDYIDPGYHRLASGLPAHNLDTWLMPREKLAPFFARTAAGADIAVIEGVMGLYDGGRGGISSTAAIAKDLQAPVILVLDASAAGESVAAAALGFKAYDPEVRLAGVIVNRLASDSHQAMVVDALNRLGIPVFGAIRRSEALGVAERHLGLTPVEESAAAAVVREMENRIAAAVDLDRIIAVARSARPMAAPAAAISRGAGRAAVGVARDEAFSFYYPESLAVLEEAGAELVPFSPLADKALPPVDGLIFGGGFPEMFLPALAANGEMHAAIRGAAERGMPVYAECGGLMYLSAAITAFSGESFPMVGLVPARCVMETRLQTVGYVEAAATGDNILCRAGDTLKGHEFHFSRMEPECPPDDFAWAFNFKKLRANQEYRGGYAGQNVLASYLHIHFAGNVAAARRFVDSCAAFRAAGG